MLLTLNPPIHHGFNNPHEYKSPTNSTPSRYPSPPRAIDDYPSRSPERRSMNTSHRGLPPPAGLTLPPPERSASSSQANSTNQLTTIQPISQPVQLPPAPQLQWQSGSTDDSMRNWLQAKTEEDRRKQEEERTKQETLRLDQRKIEQNMLREAIQGGVPPHMVPFIFTGISGANSAGMSSELLQQFFGQSQHSQSQQQQQQPPTQAQQMSPDVRRNDRMIPPNPYGSQAAIPAAATPQALHSQQFVRAQPSTLQGAPTSAPRPPHQSPGMSRLTSGEMQIQPPAPGAQYQTHPLQQTQTLPAETAVPQHHTPQQNSSPIYFHHYIPPNQQSGGSNQPSTPSTKNESPSFQHTASHLRSEYQNSPKKRKAQGAHQAAPAPTTSPSFSQHSSTGTPPGSRRNTIVTNAPAGSVAGDNAHSRRRSNTSSRGGDDRGPLPRRPSEISTSNRDPGSSPGPANSRQPSNHYHGSSGPGPTNAVDEERSDRSDRPHHGQHSMQMMYAHPDGEASRRPVGSERERLPNRD